MRVADVDQSRASRDIFYPNNVPHACITALGYP